MSIPAKESAMRERPRVLVYVPYYLPGYRAGGPVRSVSAMISQLSAEFEFYVVTSDRDLGDRQAYQGVSSGKWVEVGAAKVFYARRGRISWPELKRIVRSVE